MFTDASKSADGVGVAVVIPDMSMTDSVALNQYFSIFAAECVALVLALKMISILPQLDFTIYSDSMSVVK
ncbi:hypothetical protein AB9K17_23980, partial [Salmonella enterica subsp. enterica serovar Kentucky]|uniref:hypothetical protein n=1 Tax=Salmonella enterica TaxID=28901 RepID=UPI003F4B8973